MEDSEEVVILVDEQDNELGTEEKLAAHRDPPKLHRAFSVFIFNPEGEMLLQKRADTKYHCGGMWTNACCSHPRPGEATIDAAHRRLGEEMGFDTDLAEGFHFIYKAPFANGLTEHELDHVFIGTYEGRMDPDPEEVGGYRWVGVEELKKEVREHPGRFTPWFKIALERVLESI